MTMPGGALELVIAADGPRVGLALSGGLVAMALCLRWIRISARGLGPRALLAGLRCPAIVLVVLGLCDLRMVWRSSEALPARLVVLVDDSASMQAAVQVEPADADQPAATQAAGRASQDSGDDTHATDARHGPLTRADVAARFVGALRQAAGAARPEEGTDRASGSGEAGVELVFTPFHPPGPRAGGPRIETDLARAVQDAASGMLSREAMLLISDGRHLGAADPLDAARLAATRGIRVHTALAASWPDLPDLVAERLDVLDSEQGYPRRVLLSYSAWGLAGQAVRIVLWGDGVELASVLHRPGEDGPWQVVLEPIAPVPAAADPPNATQQALMPRGPTVLRAELAIAGPELSLANNSVSLHLEQRGPPLRVLAVGLQSDWPTRRLLRQLARQRPIELEQRWAAGLTQADVLVPEPLAASADLIILSLRHPSGGWLQPRELDALDHAVRHRGVGLLAVVSDGGWSAERNARALLPGVLAEMWPGGAGSAPPGPPSATWTLDPRPGQAATGGSNAQPAEAGAPAPPWSGVPDAARVLVARTGTGEPLALVHRSDRLRCGVLRLTGPVEPDALARLIGLSMAWLVPDRLGVDAAGSLRVGLFPAVAERSPFVLVRRLHHSAPTVALQLEDAPSRVARPGPVLEPLSPEDPEARAQTASLDGLALAGRLNLVDPQAGDSLLCSVSLELPAPPSAELRMLQADPALLRALSRATGGQVLDAFAPQVSVEQIRAWAGPALRRHSRVELPLAGGLLAALLAVFLAADWLLQQRLATR